MANPLPTTTIFNNTQIIPSIPTGVTGTIYTTYIALSWQSSPNATYYIVTSTPSTTSQTTYTSYIIFTGLTSSTHYTFTITPYNSQNIAGTPAISPLY